MKKLCYLLGFFCLIFLLHSCGNDPKIDKSLLPGKWQQGTYFEYYAADGTGHTWDEADDVNEDEAQAMTWTLDDDELTLYHKLEISEAVVPKVFTVTELTSTSLNYKNNSGKSYSFTRVK